MVKQDVMKGIKIDKHMDKYQRLLIVETIIFVWFNICVRLKYMTTVAQKAEEEQQNETELGLSEKW